MRDVDLFQLALGYEAPWYVDPRKLDAEAKRLDLYLDFGKRGRFRYRECGNGRCPAHDTSEKTWRHLHFFRHEAHLHVRFPRVSCETCGVKLVEVSWARTGSGFTLLFEAMVLALGKSMPVAAVVRLVGEQDTRLWSVLHHYVEVAREEVSHAAARRVGIDETSLKRGHHYLTLFVVLGGTRVLFATEGRDADTFRAFRRDLEANGGHPDRTGELCMGLSAVYRRGTAGAPAPRPDLNRPGFSGDAFV